MKKIVIAIIAVLALAAVMLAIYVFALKDSRLSEQGSEVQFESETMFEGESPGAQGPLAPLTAYPVAGYRVLQNSVVVVGNDGVVEELDFTGNPIRELGIINLKVSVRAEIDSTASTTALLWVDQKTQEGRWYLWKTKSGVLEIMPTTVREVSFSHAGKILRQEESEGKTTL